MADDRKEMSAGALWLLCIGGFIVVASIMSAMQPDDPQDDWAQYCSGGLTDAQRQGFYRGAKPVLGGKYIAILDVYKCPIKLRSGTLKVITVRADCKSDLEPSCSQWIQS